MSYGTAIGTSVQPIGHANHLATEAVAESDTVCQSADVVIPVRDEFARIYSGMLQALLRHSMGNAQLISKEAALPGRATTTSVADKHFVHKSSNMRGPWPEPLKVAVFATGCFWGTEKGFWRLPGVHATATGYCGGFTPNPTYEEVCSGQTGHTEAVQVIYDSEVVAYTDLLRLFWQSHDPSQGMGQGNDRGTQCA